MTDKTLLDDESKASTTGMGLWADSNAKHPGIGVEAFVSVVL
jgi:hypothetical protein